MWINLVSVYISIIVDGVRTLYDSGLVHWLSHPLLNKIAIKETENLLPVTCIKQSNCISIDCPFESV